jgi:hypothetical protein
LLEVSRQRVSALVRRRPSEGGPPGRPPAPRSASVEVTHRFETTEVERGAAQLGE